MSLTEEEKKKIEEEEKVRAEARTKYEKPPKKKTSLIAKIIAGFLGLMFVIVLFQVAGQVGNRPVSTPAPAEKKPLDAKLRFERNAVILVKNDPADWHHCQMQIGTGGAFGATYKSDYYDIVHKESPFYYSEFADSDGNRFDLLSVKPSGFYLFCKEGEGAWE